MGNTNIPQFGAAGTDNSRDTLTGTDQLTDEQRKQSGQPAGSTVPPPDTVPPAPGQSRDTPHQEDLEPTGEDEDERRNQGPDITPPAKKSSPYEGHHNTGHSPSGAT